MLRARLSSLALGGLLLSLALACSGGDSASETSSAAAGDATTARPAPPPVEPAAAPAERHERPLPAFEGATLDGTRLSVSDLLGRRAIFFFFNPDVPTSQVVGDALAAVAPERGDHNFEIVGVAMTDDAADAKGFLDKRGLPIQSFHDPGARFASRLGLRSPVAAVVVDPEGYVVAGATSFATDGPDPAGAVEGEVRSWLRLPDDDAAAAAVLGLRPKAPDFQAVRLEGGEPFQLSSLRGKATVLVFFLHTCPHCHHALEFFREALAALPEEGRPELVGISVVDRVHSVRTKLQEDGLDFFPVVMDGDGSVRAKYGANAGVPVIFLIGADGTIVSRTEGWRDAAAADAAGAPGGPAGAHAPAQDGL